MKEYTNLLRLRYDHIPVRSEKRYLPHKVERKLLHSKHLILEEKIDGSQCAVGWKTGRPYAQARSGHIPEFDKRVAFGGFWSWIWQHCEEIEKSQGHLVFGEWMKPMHSIYYDKLSDFFIAFDIWSIKQKRYLDHKTKIKLLKEWGFETTPLIYEGRIKRDEIPNIVDNRKSEFSETENCEGCVIKDYKAQLFAKYVTREFMEEIFDSSGHWTSKRKVKYNRLERWK